MAGAPARAVAPAGATSQRAARDEAIRTIPWKRLAEPHRRQVQSVVQQAGLYRRMPTRVIDCDPDIFSFLMRHPDVVVDVWQLMGISRVSLERVSEMAFRGTDGAGTTGNVRYVHADWGPNGRNLAVVYAEGAYEGKPFVKPLRAQTVLLVQSGAFQEANGRQYVTVRVDSFVNIEQMGVELVARTVQPWLNTTADRNYIETLGFLSTFSQTAQKNPQGMQRLAARLNNVDEPTRQELVQLCFQAAERYAQDDRSQWIKPYVLAQRLDELRAR